MRRSVFRGNARLVASLVFHRSNLPGVVLAVLCVALIVVYVWQVPVMRKQVRVSTQALEALQLQNATLDKGVVLSALPESSADQSKDILSVLGHERQFTSYLGVVFNLAKTSGLQLVQVEYRARVKVANGVSRHDVSIGVQGGYVQLRAFLNACMPSLPFLSLNHLEVHRDKVANAVLAARLDFSLYLSDPAATDRGLSEVAGLKPLVEREKGARQ